MGLCDGLCGVDMDAAIDLFGFACAGAEKVIVAGVGGVGCHDGADASASGTIPVANEGGGFVDLRQAVRAEHRLPQEGANARFVHGARGVVHVPVVIADRGDAGFDHFEDAELHAPVDIVGLQIGFEVPDIVIEPAYEVDILAQAAPEHHWHVGVGVDEAGQRHLPARVKQGRHLGGVDRAGRLNGADALATQQDIVRAEDGRLLVADLQDIGIENQ